ncbi:MAG TPA: His-Xaa-Ser system radical SAM maturase HxsB [Candidatus Omnitrophota bacterium]|nr:His-Xaa-Ser system radical SAM maturase HxsB [Candidatus Omnitrophota bacterium]
MSLAITRPKLKKLGFFRYRKVRDFFVLTNDAGEYCILSPREFEFFLEGFHDRLSAVRREELLQKDFIKNEGSLDRLSRIYSVKKSFLVRGPSLHIVVVTLRCDHACTYCQASADTMRASHLDMDYTTAGTIVERIFESPNMNIAIEFQGGEPLLNFKIIKFIVLAALRRNAKAGKNVRFTVVTNLALMNTAIMRFFLKYKVHICTSLDGPEQLHNKLRTSVVQKNTQKNAVRWLRILKKEYAYAKIPLRPGALSTITRFSLPYPSEIIDSYLKAGLSGIHLRPVTSFGVSPRVWKTIGIQADEFLQFYYKAFEYIIALNKKGEFFTERYAQIFLAKMLTKYDPDFLDVRSPCGAGIGQLAYDYNGDVFTCDEGRMLMRRGVDAFRLGNVRDNSYGDFVQHDTVKAMCTASCLEIVPGCSQCAYQPYCGVCPLSNFVAENDIFKKSNFLCSVQRGLIDFLFEKIRDNSCRALLENWVKH